MLLKLEEISKSFGNREDATERIVLKELSFEMDEGESVAILGPSGSGKTTLLNIIGSLDYPDSGTVTFRDRRINDLAEQELDHFRNRQIGFVFQFHHLLPQCTLLENVLIPTLMIRDKGARSGSVNRAEQLLKRVGIWEHRDKLPGRMSGGECQRAALVRAMINEPALLLADEPTGALDGENLEILTGLLLDLNRNDGLTLLVVTHSQELAARMQKTFTLRNGKLERNG
ncbi:MAG: ABC transporter ATP-binding protein [Bacteroidales bacterium]|nr:ABC transporter ATP-binding protein [Bacteroidales bacterium]